jgi:hypothetical protein
MKGEVIARLRSTHGGQPKPQQIIIASGIPKDLERGPCGVGNDSRSIRVKRAAVPAPSECPASTKPYPCYNLLLVPCPPIIIILLFIIVSVKHPEGNVPDISDKEHLLK